MNNQNSYYMIDVLYWKSVKWATRKNILLVTLLKKGVVVKTDASYCMVTLSLRKCSYVCIHFKGILGFRHCLFWRNESAEDDMSWQPFPFFVMWPKEYFPGLFSPFKISYGWKQMCLVWMMTNFKLETPSIDVMHLYLCRYEVSCRLWSLPLKKVDSDVTLSL